MYKTVVFFLIGSCMIAGITSLKCIDCGGQNNSDCNDPLRSLAQVTYCSESEGETPVCFSFYHQSNSPSVYRGCYNRPKSMETNEELCDFLRNRYRNINEKVTECKICESDSCNNNKFTGGRFV